MQNTEEIKENLEKQKEMFVATLVHDLKNPLQSQIFSLSQLRNGRFGKLSDNQSDILNMIIESSGFMQKMLDSVLDIYKFENGAVKVKPTLTNIPTLIETCIKETIGFADCNNIRIKYTNTLKSAEIMADYNLLRRVITNLLNNAVNYSYENTIVSVISQNIDENVNIKIRNYGFMIPEEIKSHIFEKFVYCQDMNRKIGAGLGLYYCKKVIEAHNGVIFLNSNKQYTEFDVLLPVENNMKIKDRIYFV